MGWGYCGTDSQGRNIGYMIHSVCDHDGCETKIDRGLDYACGGMHGEDEYSCELYFCGKHRQEVIETDQGKFISVCQSCADLRNKELSEQAEEENICAYCGKHPTEGNCAIHRDGFGEGPEVPLCDACGGEGSPTCEEIWKKTSTTVKSLAYANTSKPIHTNSYGIYINSAPPPEPTPDPFAGHRIVGIKGGRMTNTRPMSDMATKEYVDRTMGKAICAYHELVTGEANNIHTSPPSRESLEGAIEKFVKVNQQHLKHIAELQVEHKKYKGVAKAQANRIAELERINDRLNDDLLSRAEVTRSQNERIEKLELENQALAYDLENKEADIRLLLKNRAELEHSLKEAITKSSAQQTKSYNPKPRIIVDNGWGEYD